jgi:hypothetical protein
MSFLLTSEKRPSPRKALPRVIVNNVAAWLCDHVGVAFRAVNGHEVGETVRSTHVAMLVPYLQRDWQ